jgi:hypothetical protein
MNIKWNVLYYNKHIYLPTPVKPSSHLKQVKLMTAVSTVCAVNELAIASGGMLRILFEKCLRRMAVLMIDNSLKIPACDFNV